MNKLAEHILDLVEYFSVIYAALNISRLLGNTFISGFVSMIFCIIVNFYIWIRLCQHEGLDLTDLEVLSKPTEELEPEYCRITNKYTPYVIIFWFIIAFLAR